MQLYCRFNVYNRDTKVNFKPINELTGYVIEKSIAGTCFPIYNSFLF